MTAPDLMLTVPQVAERLACSPETVRRLIAKQHQPLQAMRDGALIRVRQSWLDAYIEQHMTGAQPLRRVS